MTIPAMHKDTIVVYLIEHGEQHHFAISEGVHAIDPAVNVTYYLLRRLCAEGRLEKTGPDSYRAKTWDTVGSEATP
jgi:hypothetical protein